MKRLRSGPVTCAHGWGVVLLVGLLAQASFAHATYAAPAHTYVVYTTAHGLWSVRVGGGKPHLVAQGMARPVVRMSTDGRYLLYAFPGSLIVDGVSAARGWRLLFISRVDGSAMRVVATLPASSYGAQFAWSNDDIHVLYVRVHVTGLPPRKAGAVPDWPWEIRAVNVASHAMVTAWTGQLNQFTPVPLAWRGDLGIVFATDSTAGGLSTRYAQIDVATKTAIVTRLHAIPTAHIVPSPHQHYIAMATVIDGQSNSLVGLYAAGAIGSAVTSATFAHQSVVGPLAWSLAGGDLAYTTRATSGTKGSRARTQLHVFSLLLGRDRVVGAAGPRATVVGWSPNGQWLLISDQSTTPISLYLVATSGRGARQNLVVDAPLSAAAAGFAGWGVGA